MDCRLLCVAILVAVDVTSAASTTVYTAAVYEHEVILPQVTVIPVSRVTALQNMERNLAVFRLRAAEARLQGADILVLPEDSLYGFIFTRDTIFPYLEVIPEPNETALAPCDDPDPSPGSEVQIALSCIAKQNALYLVANMGDKQPCDPHLQKNCPADGRFQYSTAVAYGPDGKLLAKYHKTHLYKEIQFNYPEPEVKYFDTPFGRFGLLICFDLLFSDPLTTMVAKHGIRNIAFPTAWMDSLPLLSAVGFHSSIARGLRVNLLSANLHLPEKRFQGSGIFGPDGMRSFYYNNTPGSSSRLLVSQVNVIGEFTEEDSRGPEARKNATEEPEKFDHFNSEQGVTHEGRKRRNTAFKTPNLVQYLHQRNKKDLASDLQDMPTFDNKNYTFVPLVGRLSDAHACRNHVCCYLKYDMLGDEDASELFVLGVFDGLFNNKYYFQVCTVLKCPSADHSSCGSYTFESRTRFKTLVLNGTFQASYVYPQLVLSRNGQLELTEAKQWSFRNNTLTITDNVTTPILSATLIGRIYSLDPSLRPAQNSGSYGRMHVFLLLMGFLLMEISTILSLGGCGLLLSGTV